MLKVYHCSGTYLRQFGAPANQMTKMHIVVLV